MNIVKGKNMDPFIRIKFKLRPDDYLKKFERKIAMPVKKKWELCNDEEKNDALKLWDPQKEVQCAVVGNIVEHEWIFKKLQELTHTNVMAERRRKKYTHLARIFWYNVIMPFRFRVGVRGVMTDALCPNVAEGSSREAVAIAQRLKTETNVLLSSWIESEFFEQYCLKDRKWVATRHDWTFKKYHDRMRGKGWKYVFIAALKSIEKVYQKNSTKVMRGGFKQYGILRKRVQEILKRSLEKENATSHVNMLCVRKKKVPVILKRTPRNKGSGSSSSAVVGKKRKAVTDTWTPKDVSLLKSHKNFKKVMTEEITIQKGADSMSSLFPTWDIDRIYRKLYKLRVNYRKIQEQQEQQAAKGLMLLNKCPRCHGEVNGKVDDHLKGCHWI